MRHLYTADVVITDADDPSIEAGGVIVDGSAIAWVGPLDALPTDSFDCRTDLPGSTLMPGLIDSHVHLGFDGGPNPVARMMSESDAEQTVLMLQSARQLLSVGVTTARDLGARGYLDVVVRDAIRNGDARGPRLLVAGAPLTPTGGHCWFMGAEVDGTYDIRKAVRRHHKHQVDHIKVMSTGGFMTPGSAPWYAQFSLEEMRLIVDEAHRVGKRVAAHAHGTEGIERALEAGVDTLEHCSFSSADGTRAFDEKLAARIAASSAFVSPTINLRAPELQDMMGQDAFSERITGLYEAGCKIIASTDSGIDNTPHHGYVRGLLAMEQFGLPRDEVIRSATSQAADALGIGGVTGRIREGLAADFIAVRGNPRNDLAVLNDVALIIANGEEFVPDALPEIGETGFTEPPSFLTTKAEELLERG